MANLTDKISLEIEDGTKTAGTGIAKIVSDLKELRAGMANGLTGVRDLQAQLKALGIDLSKSTLKSSISTINSDILRYVTSSNQLVTVNRKIKNGLDTYTVSLKNVNKELKNGVSLWDAFTKGVSGAIVKMKIVFGTLTSGANKLVDLIKSASEYEEALNLFTVSMGSQAEEATKWIERFSEALYMDPSNIMQYMGSLNSLISGLGVGAENSYLMSKNLTQLAYDLASFKNLSVEEAFTKLQSGISGEIEPLRNVGVALSQNTLQELANSLGIQRRVAEMSEAEKAQLRYIQILKSTSDWQGDMGRTLISPANSIRVLKEQFTQLGRAIGRIFIPIIMKAIPYVIALTEILTDLANRLADFLGYEFADIDYSGLEDVKTEVGNIGTEADKTTNKLNTMLAPFDELNVVQNKTNSAGSGLGGVGGDLGVDLPEYDALADLTEKFKENVDEARANLETLWSVAKKVAIVLGSLWAFDKIVKFIKYVTGVKDLFSRFKRPTSILSGLLKTLVTRFSDGYKYSKYMGQTGLKAVLSGTKNLLTPLGKLGTTLGGVVGSFLTGYHNMEDYVKGDSELRDSILKTTGVTLGLATAATFLVSPWAGLGIVISGVVGSVLGYKDSVNELEVLNNIFDGQGTEIESLTGYYTNLFNESTKYVDTIEDLSDKYQTAKESVQISRDEIDSFRESLDLQGEAVSQSQLDELSSKYDNLREETTLAHEASDNYYIALIKASAEARGAVEEDTLAQITAYKATSSTLLGYEQDYIDKEEELTRLLYEGAITTAEYNQRLHDLQVAYGYVADDVLNTTYLVGEFEENLSDIDYSSVENLNENLSTTKTEFDDTIKKLEEYKKQIQENNDAEIASKEARIELLKASKDANSEYTQGLIKALEEEVAYIDEVTDGFVKSVDDNIRSVQGDYKGYLATIYGDLSTQGADTVKEFSGTMDTIEGELKGLKDVDMSGLGAELFNSLENSIVGTGDTSLIAQLRDAMKKVGVAGSASLMQYLTPEERKRQELSDIYRSLGEDINAGTAFGLNSTRKELIDIIGKTSYEMQWEMEDVNDMHSPSAIYEGYGMNIVMGLANGIEDYKQNVINALLSLTNDMTNIMNSLQFTLNTSGFDSGLNSLLGKLQTFADKFRSGINSLMSSFTTTMNGVKVGSDNRLYYTKMPYIKIPRFETGGYPPSGDLFYANENGIPEMVGRIGNQTAVANNDQITSAITNALITALNNYNFGNNQPSTTIVNIAGRKVYEGVGDYVDSENDRYGTSYISI